MRQFCLLLAVVVAQIVWAGVAPSATLAVRGGNVSLLLTTATAGQEPDPAVALVANALKYRKGNFDPPQKITAQTDLGTPRFDLKVEAVGVRSGISTGEVPLATTAQDLITNITRRGARSCDLRYTLEAQVSDGTGMDVHTVTYTIMAE